MIDTTIVKNSIFEHFNVLKALNEIHIEDIAKVSILFSEKPKNFSSIFWCGDGGSASDSQHLLTELNPVVKARSI